MRSKCINSTSACKSVTGNRFSGLSFLYDMESFAIRGGVFQTERHILKWFYICAMACIAVHWTNKNNVNTHSVHVVTKWWRKGVGVGEKAPTENYIKLVLVPQMGQGIMPNTFGWKLGNFIVELSGNHASAFYSRSLCTVNLIYCVLQLIWMLTVSEVDCGKPSMVICTVSGWWCMWCIQ